MQLINLISSALVCLAWLCMPHGGGLSACTCCHAVRPSMLRRFTALMGAPSGETPTDGSSKKAKLARQRSSKEPMMQHNPCAYDPGAEPDGRRVACMSTQGSCIPGSFNGRMHPHISKCVQRQQPVSGSQGPVHKLKHLGYRAANLQGIQGPDMHCALEFICSATEEALVAHSPPPPPPPLPTRLLMGGGTSASREDAEPVLGPTAVFQWCCCLTGACAAAHLHAADITTAAGLTRHPCLPSG